MFLKPEIQGTVLHTKTSSDYLVCIVLRYFVVSNTTMVMLCQRYTIKKNIDVQFLPHILEYKLHKSIFSHPAAVSGSFRNEISQLSSIFKGASETFIR